MASAGARTSHRSSSLDARTALGGLFAVGWMR
jgi:hypothetical protein